VLSFASFGGCSGKATGMLNFILFDDCLFSLLSVEEAKLNIPATTATPPLEPVPS